MLFIVVQHVVGINTSFHILQVLFKFPIHTLEMGFLVS